MVVLVILRSENAKTYCAVLRKILKLAAEEAIKNLAHPRSGSRKLKKIQKYTVSHLLINPFIYQAARDLVPAPFGTDSERFLDWQHVQHACAERYHESNPLNPDATVTMGSLCPPALFNFLYISKVL